MDKAFVPGDFVSSIYRLHIDEIFTCHVNPALHIIGYSSLSIPVLSGHR